MQICNYVKFKVQCPSYWCWNTAVSFVCHSTPWQVVWGPATLLCGHNRLWPSKYKILTVRPFIENAWRTLPYGNIRKSFFVFWVEPQTSRSPNSNLTLELLTDSQVASEGILSILPAIAPRSLDAFSITLVSVIEVQNWGERSLVNGQRLAGALGTELECEVLQGCLCFYCPSL